MDSFFVGPGGWLLGHNQQCLGVNLLALCSGVIHGSVQETIWEVGDQAQVSLVQGKHPTCYALVLAPRKMGFT